MTQYLQTQTDILQRPSHAGISDHTSYWGKDIGDIRTVKFPWRIVIRGAILIFL